jgi:thiamine-phosphate pyrophosphorylase
MIEAAIGRTVDAVKRLAGVRLCVLIDGRASEAEFAALVRELIDEGVGMIQLRDKTLPVRELVERARLLVHSVRDVGASSSPDQVRQDEADPRWRAWSGLAGANAPRRSSLAIINDRPAVAAAVDADGVHVGQDDFTVKDARAVIGPRKLIGVSTHSIEQARQAVLGGANYIGVGPTFPSATKQFDAFPGLELLRAVAAKIRLPAFAIGGINADNVADVAATGFTRVAVSSAVTGAASASAAAQQLLASLTASAVVSRPASRV